MVQLIRNRKGSCLGWVAPVLEPGAWNSVQKQTIWLKVAGVAGQSGILIDCIVDIKLKRKLVGTQRASMGIKVLQ